MGELKKKLENQKNNAKYTNDSNVYKFVLKKYIKPKKQFLQNFVTFCHSKKK